jgi:hypothetical protein
MPAPGIEKPVTTTDVPAGFLGSAFLPGTAVPGFDMPPLRGWIGGEAGF